MTETSIAPQAAQTRRTFELHPGVFLMPMALFMFAVFCIPLAGVIAESVYDNGVTLSAYATFADGLLFRRALSNTLEIGLSSGLICVVLGYVVALHLSRQSPRQRSFYLVMVMLPFWTSILVKSFAFTVILGANGIVNNIVHLVLGEGTTLQLLFNRIGVLIAMTHWLLPFAVFPILSSLMSQDKALRDAAEVMGASPSYIFWRITFPLSLPGVIAGGLMTSVIGMGSFVTPALLGGRGDLMMANLVDFYVREALDWRMASAIAVVLILIALVVLSMIGLAKLLAARSEARA